MIKKTFVLERRTWKLIIFEYLISYNCANKWLRTNKKRAIYKKMHRDIENIIKIIIKPDQKMIAIKHDQIIIGQK